MDIESMKALLMAQVKVYIEIANVPECVDQRGTLGIGAGRVTAENYVCPLYERSMKDDDEPLLRRSLREMHGKLVLSLWLYQVPLRDDIETVVKQGWEFYPKRESVPV